MTRYDFTGAADFLNHSVPLDSLYDEVHYAWSTVAGQRLSKKKKGEVWSALTTCLDFLQTIQVKQKGGGK